MVAQFYIFKKIICIFSSGWVVVTTQPVAAEKSEEV